MLALGFYLPRKIYERCSTHPGRQAHRPHARVLAHEGVPHRHSAPGSTAQSQACSHQVKASQVLGPLVCLPTAQSSQLHILVLVVAGLPRLF